MGVTRLIHKQLVTSPRDISPAMGDLVDEPLAIGEPLSKLRQDVFFQPRARSDEVAIHMHGQEPL